TAPTSPEFLMNLQEKEAIENMLSITNEGEFVGGSEDGIKTQGEEFEPEGTTGEPARGPDPPSEDPTPGPSQEPQVSADPAPSPYLDVEPLTVIMLETSPALPRRKVVVSEDPIPKRPTTSLQKKEALESSLKKSQAKSRRRKLVKDGKVVNEKIALVENVDEEEAEEPSTLTRKLSQKHGILKPKGGSSVSAERLTRSDDAVATEKLSQKHGEKSVKSNKKEKGVRKTTKRKVDTDEEPDSSKKARVGNPGSVGKERLRSQKVLWGRTFASDVLEEAGMRQLVEVCDFQQWTHLFTRDAARMYKEEVQSFYADLYKVEDGHICALVNGVDMVMDSVLLGSVLGVPTEGLSSVRGACTQNFRNAILKDIAVQQGERVQKKALSPVYQLLFEMVNKVLLPRAERISITSHADLFLMEELDNFTTINLPGIIIEHMNKVADFKDGNHGLPYGFLLTKVFEHFKVPLGPVKVGTKKETFSKGTLEECECIAKFGGVASTSTISQLINAQNQCYLNSVPSI
ncbi:PREDICTED: uncharacterized protein LOC109205987, partial [Nicotiana attenuata]|uniref:uncharacterized protein LOC109205987 n=1 Tax=Nicotiana attenuata TaxID=49451 RepID=UPI0009059563